MTWLHVLAAAAAAVLGEHRQSFFGKYRHSECKYLGELTGTTCLRDWVEATIWGYSLSWHLILPLFFFLLAYFSSLWSSDLLPCGPIQQLSTFFFTSLNVKRMGGGVNLNKSFHPFTQVTASHFCMWLMFTATWITEAGFISIFTHTSFTCAN